jgi:hypothetical protein
MTSEARNVSSESEALRLWLIEANRLCVHPTTLQDFEVGARPRGSLVDEASFAAINAALALRDKAYRAGQEWQDIANAPRDGKPFLAYCIERGWGDTGPTYTVQLARWRDSYFASTNGAIPTHWQPLPLPPIG